MSLSVDPQSKRCWNAAYLERFELFLGEDYLELDAPRLGGRGERPGRVAGVVARLEARSELGRGLVDVDVQLYCSQELRASQLRYDFKLAEVDSRTFTDVSGSDPFRLSGWSALGARG